MNIVIRGQENKETQKQKWDSEPLYNVLFMKLEPTACLRFMRCKTIERYPTSVKRTHVLPCSKINMNFTKWARRPKPVLSLSSNFPRLQSLSVKKEKEKLIVLFGIPEAVDCSTG